MKEKIAIWLLLITSLVLAPGLVHACKSSHMSGNRLSSVHGAKNDCQFMTHEPTDDIQRFQFIRTATGVQAGVGGDRKNCCCQPGAGRRITATGQKGEVKAFNFAKAHQDLQNCLDGRVEQAMDCCSDNIDCTGGTGCSGCSGCYCTLPGIAPMLLTSLPSFELPVQYKNLTAHICSPMHLPAGFGFIWRPPKIVFLS